MGTALEGYVACGGRYDPVDSIERPGKRRYLRGQVLGLDLRNKRRDGATVLVCSNPQTGEEFDGALEEAERRRQIAEQCASAAENQAEGAENRLLAAGERARALEEQLRNLTGRARQPGRDSWGQVRLRMAMPSVCRGAGPGPGTRTSWTNFLEVPSAPDTRALVQSPCLGVRVTVALGFRGSTSELAGLRRRLANLAPDRSASPRLEQPARRSPRPRSGPPVRLPRYR